MGTDFIKELMAIKEASSDGGDLAVSAVKVDDEVHDQLQKASEEDDVDSTCFGLEMEDGKVVKVYVKKEDAEEFEKALEARLGEDDDIQATLEDMEKDFEILEIKWPDEDTEDPDEDTSDEDSGADSMNSEVDYNDDGEPDNKGKQESLGQAFAKKALAELKWSDEESSEYKNAATKDDDDESEEETAEPEKPKTQAPQGADTSWKVEKDDDGMTITNDRFTIELDDSEANTLTTAIADKKIARFKNEQGKVVYVFSPRGSEYILKTPEYQGGFRIPKDIVNKLMD